jgi:hypothetical protein
MIVKEQESVNTNEQKQTQFFQKVLDLTLEKFEEIKLEGGSDFKTSLDQLNNALSLLDAIHQDFCKHLEVSSFNVKLVIYLEKQLPKDNLETFSRL